VKKTKSTERLEDSKDSPYTLNKPVTLTKTKESGRIIKNAAKSLSKKEIRIKENFLINSNSSKNIQAQKSLPKLNGKERIGESSKISTFQSILNIHSKKKLRHISLNEELQFNSFVISEGSECKAKSWLENIIAIKDKRVDGDLNENFKFCNGIIRDVIVRLKQGGKENESILIEKIWRVIFEMIDEYMEKLQSKLLEYEKNSYLSAKANEITQKLKEEVQVLKNEICVKDDQIVEFEKKIRELDMDNEKLKFELSLNDCKVTHQEMLKFQPLVDRVQSRIEELADIYQLNELKRQHIKRKSVVNPNWFLTRNKMKNKKSMDLLRPNLFDIPPNLTQYIN
jgi:hypothetical protein